MIIKTPSDIYSQIEFTDLYSYLQMSGWTKERVVQDKFVVFNKWYDENEFDVIVPLKNTFKDYSLRMQTTIHILSNLEGIDEAAMINKIKNINTDIIKVRFISADYKDGSIPLWVANSITKSLYETVIYSASMEENQRLKYHRISTGAKEYANKFRFGQTQKGSFIVSLEAKLHTACEQLSLDLENYDREQLLANTPFERRIINRINSTLIQLDNLIIDDDLFINEDSKMLNINICEALSELDGIADDLEVEYNFDLSETVPIAKQFSKKVIINNEVISKARTISQKFKSIEKREPIVVDVNVDKVTSIDKGGEVSVSFNYSEDNKRHIAKINLEGNSYIKACESLTKPNCQFRVEGILDRTTRNWIIEDIKRFEELL